MQKTEFEGVSEWPEQDTLSSGRDARLDNQPPLEERILLEFQNDLDMAAPGEKTSVSQRIAELLESASKVPAIESQAIAGKVGDLIKMAADVGKRVDAARERHNRPLLNAQRGLKARADAVVAPLVTEIGKVRAALNAYMAEEARKAAERQRQADEEARRAREAAEAERQRVMDESKTDLAEMPELPPEPKIEAAHVEKPVARGDYGARVGTRKVWHHEIESVRQLPDRILKHPKVLDALNVVIAAEMRGMGENKTAIKGTRIWSTDEAVVR